MSLVNRQAPPFLTLSVSTSENRASARRKTLWIYEEITTLTRSLPANAIALTPYKLTNSSLIAAFAAQI
ncbi:hypothetical protein ACFQDZ_03390 [Sulfitobacter pacificus]|uniref:hypothetical protein n=1 Tax=Sulfitobacter pacificus TaxID=1499314 RepID=UPI0036162792